MAGMDDKISSITKKTIMEDNMKKLFTILLALIAISAFVSPLYATDKTGTAGMSADKLEGMKVVSQSGEDIGKIKSAHIDNQSGNIRFVTISQDGQAGMGHDTAVPIDALRVDQQNDQATLTVDSSKLDNVPQQANMSDDDFQRQLDSHYGVAPSWEAGSTKDNNSLETGPAEPTGLSQPGRYYPKKN